MVGIPLHWLLCVLALPLFCFVYPLREINQTNSLQKHWNRATVCLRESTIHIHIAAVMPHRAKKVCWQPVSVE